MEGRVECGNCHRVERWRVAEGTVAHAVVVPGGARRPPVHPEWQRGESALACALDPRRHVVGICDACGQLMVSEDAELRAIPVEVDTPDGRLRFDAHRVEGPHGLVSPDEAQAWLARAFAPRRRFDVRAAILELPLLLVVLAVGSAFAIGLGFVVLMIAVALAAA